MILGTPVLTAIGPLALQVAWGVLTPLLMWALAIAVVWFGIEHLVVRWITYLERITSAYAAGRHNVRPERVSAAPAEIRSLGETFSRMADLISAREAELRDSLAQKEVLVREIHHRVKNNLQLVMSLLNLHARRIRDPRAEAGVRRSAQSHQRARDAASPPVRIGEPAGDRPEVVPRGSVRRAAPRRSVARPAGRADQSNSPSEVIGPEIAVPLGLLVTEAITNAYKHAFNERSGGHIYVEVQRAVARRRWCWPCATTARASTPAAGEDSTGLGRSLIEAFVRQLRGELEITGDAGTSLVVRFPAAGENRGRGHCARAGPASHRPSSTDRRSPRRCRTRSPAEPHGRAGKLVLYPVASAHDVSHPTCRAHRARRGLQSGRALRVDARRSRRRRLGQPR